MNSDIKEVEWLLKNGASPHLTVRNVDLNQSLLEKAVDKDNVELVRLLLQAGANPNQKASLGYNLVNACYIKNLQIIDLLLQYGFDPNKKEHRLDNRTVMYDVITMEYKDVFKKFVAHGANLKVRDNKGDTLLHVATRPDDIEFAKILIEHGVDVNSCNKDGDTPLMLAVIHGRKELVKYLLQSGANPNAVNKEGTTALMFLRDSRSLELLNAFIKAGADVNAKDKNDNSILMQFIAHFPKEERDETLNSYRKVIFLYSHRASLEDYDCIEALLKAHADINVRNKHLETAMSIAKTKENPQLIALLQAQAAIKQKERCRLAFLSGGLTMKNRKKVSGEPIPKYKDSPLFSFFDRDTSRDMQIKILEHAGLLAPRMKK